MTTRKPKPMTLAQVKQELAEVARIGQMFIDGDLCRTALQPYAQTFMTGDDMDFNPASCVPLKKTLLRLERLGRVPCATTLWRRRPDFPGSGEALILGSSATPLGAEKPGNRGYEPPAMGPELASVFLKGKPAWRVVRNQPGTRVLIDRGLAAPTLAVSGTAVVQLFVPIKDSMGEIAAALEVFTVATGT